MAATLSQQQQMQAAMMAGGQAPDKGWKSQLKMPPKDNRQKTSDVTDTKVYSSDHPVFKFYWFNSCRDVNSKTSVSRESY